MVWNLHAPQGYEVRKIRAQARLYLNGRGLDIGCGPEKVVPHAIGVDSARDAGMPLADVAADGRKLDWIASGSMDFVFSSHFLEHCVDYKAALREWWRVLKVGGHLILYLPHRDFYPNIGKEGANPDHKHDFHPDDIKRAMFEVTESRVNDNCVQFDVLEDEDHNDMDEYSFYLVFRKRDDGQGQYNPWSRSPLREQKTVVVCRYGAIGDMALVSSVVALYKQQGYRVILSTSEFGRDIMRHDPNIDEFLLHEADNSFVIGAMEPFWWMLEKRYGRVINLTQSIEGFLLPSPGHMHHDYPLDVRKNVLNVNYMERTHDLAGLGYDFSGLRFHPSLSEAADAATLADEFTEKHSVPLLGVCLAGSGVHKAYPWLHVLIARVMYAVPCNVVLFGSDKDAIKEEAIVQHCVALGIDAKRFIRTVQDKWPVRRSLTFSLHCDVLFGPETGIMQWNGMNERNIKVIMLSHSTITNLTKWWKNTQALYKPVPCGPCHRKHWDFTYCTQGKSGASVCMEIPVEPVAGAIINAISTVQEVRRQHANPQESSAVARIDPTPNRWWNNGEQRSAGSTSPEEHEVGKVIEADAPFIPTPQRIASHNGDARRAEIIE